MYVVSVFQWNYIQVVYVCCCCGECVAVFIFFCFFFTVFTGALQNYSIWRLKVQ